MKHVWGARRGPGRAWISLRALKFECSRSRAYSVIKGLRRIERSSSGMRACSWKWASPGSTRRRISGMSEVAWRGSRVFA